MDNGKKFMRLIIKYSFITFCITFGTMFAASAAPDNEQSKDDISDKDTILATSQAIVRKKRPLTNHIKQNTSIASGPTLAANPYINSGFASSTGPTLSSAPATNSFIAGGPTLTTNPAITNSAATTGPTLSNTSTGPSISSPAVSGPNIVSNGSVSTGPSSPPTSTDSNTKKVTAQTEATNAPSETSGNKDVSKSTPDKGRKLPEKRKLKPKAKHSATSTKPSSAALPAKETVKSEFPDIKEVPSPVPPKKTFFSMADKPQNEAQQEFIEDQIKAVPDFDIKNPPDLEPIVDASSDKQEAKDIYLGQYIEPWQGHDPNETIEMNFDNKEIIELLKFLETNLDITFILDDYVEPKRADGLKVLAGTKITFKSNVPVTLKDAWDLGLTFLEMSGFSVIPTTLPRTYHVTAASGDRNSANNNPLPTFIGTDSGLLPNSDIKIRYVYFIENSEIDTISKVVDTLRTSSSAAPIKFPELRAILVTDKSANIKSMLKIINEIDKVSTPEMLSIIRLKHADASDIQRLYQELIGKDQKGQFPFRPRKSSTTHYFTESTRVFADPRTNSLIILGTRENIKRFEDFVSGYIDKQPDLPYSPLHIYPLKYIEAESIASILNGMIQQFNSDPSRAAAAAVGGVRDGNKFFNPSVKITAEPSGNRLIINADYDDYLKLRELLEGLDIEQPQVALKIMILDVDLTNAQQFGTQIRNSKECCDNSGGTTSVLGGNINAQFSGLNGIITRETAPNGAFVSGAERLLGNLINIANLPAGGGPGLFGTGTTLVTLGKDIFGFWGLLSILESITRVSVVANPFLVTSNKYKAEVTVGETRRVLTSIVQAQSSQTALGNLDANLSVVITPQISYDDMITMNIYVELTQFTTGGDLPTRLTKQVSTEAIAKNREVIALGGLIRETISEQEFKIPILGDIPLIGWLFKNKVKTAERTSIIILISPEIIKPHQPEIGREFTQYQLNSVKDTLYTMYYPQEERDPIHRWFFGDHKERTIADIDKFTSTSSRYAYKTEKEEADIQINRLNEGLSNEPGINADGPPNGPNTGSRTRRRRPLNMLRKKQRSLLDALEEEPSTKELR